VIQTLLEHIPSGSIRQLLANFSGVEFWRSVSKFRKRKKKVVLCSRPLQNVKLGSFTS